LRRAVSALRLDGTLGADGGFEDVSKPDGHHDAFESAFDRLKIDLEAEISVNL
jgi:hypothetical protein